MTFNGTGRPCAGCDPDKLALEGMVLGASDQGPLRDFTSALRLASEPGPGPELEPELTAAGGCSTCSVTAGFFHRFQGFAASTHCPTTTCVSFRSSSVSCSRPRSLARISSSELMLRAQNMPPANIIPQL